MDKARHACLAAMGIDVWVRRELVKVSPQPPPADAAAPVAADDGPPAVGHLGWQALEATVARCSQCGLHGGRTQTVFGVGSREADWLIIGEAPGAEEDRRGEPFVGRAGQLLNSMLAALGFAREDVFIANILKCRPPQNRDPRPQEVVCCEPYLKRQITLLKPRIILALGRVAAQNLLKVTTPIGRMRGQRYAYGELETPVIVTYHPAYLLRSPLEKSKVWDDLLLARRVYGELT